MPNIQITKATRLVGVANNPHYRDPETIFLLKSPYVDYERFR